MLSFFLLPTLGAGKKPYSLNLFVLVFFFPPLLLITGRGTGLPSLKGKIALCVCSGALFFPLSDLPNRSATYRPFADGVWLT